MSVTVKYCGKCLDYKGHEIGLWTRTRDGVKSCIYVIRNKTTWERESCEKSYDDCRTYIDTRFNNIAEQMKRYKHYCKEHRLDPVNLSSLNFYVKTHPSARI